MIGMGYENNFSDDGEECDDQYYESYADLRVHRLMLSDKPRMQFYRAAITDCISRKENQVVVDVGSGSGILSCWAALVGAAHVFSIEPSMIAQYQQEICTENNITDKVTLLATAVEKIIDDGVEEFIRANPVVVKFGGVHIIVSEWMGFYLFHEGMLPSLLRARDFFRAVNNAIGDEVVLDMIPSTATLYVAPVSLKSYYETRFHKFWSCIEGVKMQTLAHADYEATLDAASPLVDVIPASALLHEGHVFWSASLLTVLVGECTHISSMCRFLFDESAVAQRLIKDHGNIVVDGFCIWFNVEHGAHQLCTSPLAHETHWKQVTVVLPSHVRQEDAVSFQSGDEALNLRLQLSARDTQQRCYIIKAEIN